jgi:hypothetical protein
MKKTITLLFLLSMSLTDSFGQWYVRKYNVTDINYLTKEQLEEALKGSKTGVYGSLAVAGLGGVMILIERLVPYNLEDEEDPSFIEQLLGDRGMHVVIIGAGIGLAGAGTIACFYYLGRSGTIRSALNKNFQSLGSLKLTPAIVLERHSNSLCPGLSLTYSF